MADTNFIDYVKILCRSGKGRRKEAAISTARSMYPKAAPTAATAAAEAI